jgi:hypothetical protein
MTILVNVLTASESAEGKRELAGLSVTQETSKKEWDGGRVGGEKFLRDGLRHSLPAVTRAFQEMSSDDWRLCAEKLTYRML